MAPLPALGTDPAASIEREGSADPGTSLHRSSSDSGDDSGSTQTSSSTGDA